MPCKWRAERGAPDGGAPDKTTGMMAGFPLAMPSGTRRTFAVIGL